MPTNTYYGPDQDNDNNQIPSDYEEIKTILDNISKHMERQSSKIDQLIQLMNLVYLLAVLLAISFVFDLIGYIF